MSVCPFVENDPKPEATTPGVAAFGSETTARNRNPRNDVELPAPLSVTLIVSPSLKQLTDVVMVYGGAEFCAVIPAPCEGIMVPQTFSGTLDG